MKTLRYAIDNGIATITFDEPGSPVNTMCQAWQDDLTAAVAQAVKIVTLGKADIRSGGTLALCADTICVHGDRPDAALFARRLHEALESARVAIARV